MAYNLYDMIPIYKSEKELGLAQAINDNRTLAYCSVARSPQDVNYEKFFAEARNSNPDQIDLHYMDSVLVSVGWNKNDDIFTPEQVWAARKTPVDKKFNYMHDEKDIIGHMTDSFAVDGDGNTISDDLSFDEIPEQFDIIVASVLYKTWKNEDLQDRMNQILNDIPEDKWFVSMECLFAGFDYGLENEDGTQKIVSRNQATAFLSKYLRAYGGEGTFEGQKIGRVLRNFVFSGKGLVDKPANETSIIFNKNNPFNATATLNHTVAEEQNMTDVTEKAVASLQAQVDKLEAERNSLKEKLEAEAKQANAAEMQKLQEEIDSLKNEVSAKVSLFEDKEKELATANETIANTEKAKAELETKVKELEAAKAKSDRVSQLVDANVSKEEADAIVEKWLSANDEQFADVVELHANKFTDMLKEKQKKKDDKNKKDAEASEVVEEVDNELEEAEASEIDIPTEQDDTSELQTATASWLENLFNSK